MLSVLIFVNLISFVFTQQDSCSIDQFDEKNDENCSSLKIPSEWQKFLQDYQKAKEASDECDDSKESKFHCVFSDVMDKDLDQFESIT